MKKTAIMLIIAFAIMSFTGCLRTEAELNISDKAATAATLDGAVNDETKIGDITESETYEETEAERGTVLTETQNADPETEADTESDAETTTGAKNETASSPKTETDAKTENVTGTENITGSETKQETTTSSKPESETAPETERKSDCGFSWDVTFSSGCGNEQNSGGGTGSGETTAPVTEKAPGTEKTPETEKTPGTETKPSTSNDYASEVTRLVNEIRRSYGLSELTLDNGLSRVAQAKSQDMHDVGYFAHESPTYGSPFDMMKSFGITYRAAGENIARGYRTPESVVDAWMNSEGHRANILSSKFTKIGIGYVADGNYWCQMFIG